MTDIIKLKQEQLMLRDLEIDALKRCLKAQKEAKAADEELESIKRRVAECKQRLDNFDDLK